MLNAKILCVSILLVAGSSQYNAESELSKQVAILRERVSTLESQAKIWNMGLGTEYALTKSEQAIVDELVRLKKQVTSCCPQ